MAQSVDEELVDCLRRRECVLVVGTGVTKNAAEAPALTATWKGLLCDGLDYMEKHLPQARLRRFQDRFLRCRSDLASNPTVDVLLDCASVIKEALSERFYQWFKNALEFKIDPNSRLIPALGRLDQPIATLNYDDLLEKCTGKGRIIYERVGQLQQWLSRGDAILHLHGHKDEPRTEVFTRGDYARIENNRSCQHYLRVLFSASRLVFVGCGRTTDDPNFRQLVRWYKNLLGSDPPLHNHFVLVSESDPRLTCEDDQSFIRPICYGAHDRLATFLEDLAERAGLSQTTTEKVVGNFPKGPELADSVPLRSELLEQLRSERRSNIIILYGPEGGEGKTTLLRDFVYEYEVRSRSKIIFWTFYEQQRDQGAGMSATAFLNTCIDTLETEEAEQNNLKLLSVSEKARRIYELAKEQSISLALDGLEPMQNRSGSIEDQALVKLLRFAGESGRVPITITTRLSCSDLQYLGRGGVKTIKVPPLKPSEAKRLLLALSVKESLRSGLAKHLEGHVLSLVLAAAFCSRFEALAASFVQRIEESGGTPLNRVLSALSSAGEDESWLALFKAVSLFSAPCEEEAAAELANYLGWGVADIDTDAKVLWDLRLLSHRRTLRRTLDTHPRLREYFQKILQKDVDIWRKANLWLYEYYIRRNPSDLLFNREAMTELFYAMQHAVKAGGAAIPAAVQEVYYGRMQHENYCTNVLHDSGTPLDALRALYTDPDEFAGISANLPLQDRARVLSETGFLLRASGRLAEAKQVMQKASSAWREIPDHRRLAIDLENQSEVHLLCGELSDAERLAGEGVAAANTSGDGYRTLMAYAALGDVLIECGNWTQGLLHLKSVYDEWKKEYGPGKTSKFSLNNPSRDSIRALYYLGAIADSDFGKCEEVVSKCETISEWSEVASLGKREPTKHFRGANLSYLGLALSRTGRDPNKADLILTNAWRLLFESGQVYHQPRALTARAEHFIRVGKTDLASIELGRLDALLEDLGMKLYRINYFILRAELAIKLGQGAGHDLEAAYSLRDSFGFCRHNAWLEALYHNETRC